MTWNAVGTALLELVFCAVCGLASNDKTFSTIMFTIAGIAFAAIIHKLIGVVFDPPDRDRAVLYVLAAAPRSGL